MVLSKIRFGFALSLVLLLGSSAMASQFAECRVAMFDDCPKSKYLSCKSYRVMGKSFDASSEIFAFPLTTADDHASAEQSLVKLVNQEVCPGVEGSEPQLPMDGKYIKAAEAFNKAKMKKIKLFL